MSARQDFKGDYMGFTYNGKHSSELGIVRVSDGSRFNENLLPTIQDKTVQVPGGDGMYYFGSYYTQRQFNVNFAFDSLDETGIAELKKHFGDKQIHDLIFDETPYKVWSAKVTGTATLKYIPFGEGETGRTYRGEGTIQFTCYQSYARVKSKSPYDYVTMELAPEIEGRNNNKRPDQYFFNKETGMFEPSMDPPYPGMYYCSEIGNFNEWSVASGITDLSYEDDSIQFDEFAIITDTSSLSCGLYNPGEKPSDFLLICFGIGSSGSISVGNGPKLSWNGLALKGEDDGVIFNSKIGLIQGIIQTSDGYEITQNVYNEYIDRGGFFQIPITKEKDPYKAPQFCFENSRGDMETPILKYDYYYL